FRNIHFLNSRADSAGGAISMRNSNLTIRNGYFDSSVAESFGGGINVEGDSTLNVSDLRMNGGRASTGGGGGIYIGPGNSRVAITTADFEAHTASAYGGAIRVDGGALDMHDVRVRYASVDAGGGFVAVFGGSTTIEDFVF